MSTEREELPTLGLSSIADIVRLVGEIQREDMEAGRGIKVAHTRLRVKLAELSKLCKVARADVLDRQKALPKHGKVRSEGGEGDPKPWQQQQDS